MSNPAGGFQAEPRDRPPYRGSKPEVHRVSDLCQPLALANHLERCMHGICDRLPDPWVTMPPNVPTAAGGKNASTGTMDVRAGCSGLAAGKRCKSVAVQPSPGPKTANASVSNSHRHESQLSTEAVQEFRELPHKPANPMRMTGWDVRNRKLERSPGAGSRPPRCQKPRPMRMTPPVHS